MEAYKEQFTEESSLNIRQWRNVYITGGYAALICFCLTLCDIIFGSIVSRDLSTLPHTAIDRFVEFNNNWLLGLYHLDLLNVIISIVMLPAYFALISIHRRKSLPYGIFTMLLIIIGTTTFISSNSALPMLELSRKYYSAVDETQKMLIAAAGEALLVRGEHGGLGVFFGFILQTIASLCVSLEMLHGRIFSRTISYFGIIGYSFLLLYILLVTFIPSIKSIAVFVAAPGGILALLWVFGVGVKLIKLANTSINH